MARGKIEIKRIENSSNRQVTYSKRRNGILKKAKEITVLCDAKVSLVIFASSGKMLQFCSPSTTLIEVLDNYHKQSGKRLWDAKHENLRSEVDRVKKENDNMQIELRHLKGDDIGSLNHIELGALEEALENGLASVRVKKEEFINNIRENGEMLEQENKRLNYELHLKDMKLEEKVREMDINGFHHYIASHMPFAYRVQPNQPNLHERI